MFNKLEIKNRLRLIKENEIHGEEGISKKITLLTMEVDKLKKVRNSVNLKIRELR